MASALPTPRSPAVYRHAARRVASRSIWRYSAWDALFVGLSALHLAVLIAAPSILVIAIGQWWNANTIAHNFIHRPFFRPAWANQAYSGFLSLLLGFPQRLWRERHLLHHAGLSRRAHLSRAMGIEVGLVFTLWAVLIARAPNFFWFVYIPGWALGLVICQLQGHFEHARGTTSHYGRLYNTLFFNDGLHVEHHQRPTLHWRDLGSLTTPTTQRSRWPPVLRWLDACSLAGLERVVLRSARLQRWVIDVHARAMGRLIDPSTIDTAVVVGGGLFPRTARVLAELNPEIRVIVVERDAEHIEAARLLLPPQATVRHAAFDPVDPIAADLLVIPLGFVGNRHRIYEHPPAPRVLVHDWIWNLPSSSRKPQASSRVSVIVSWWLLKRLTLITSSAR